MAVRIHCDRFVHGQFGRFLDRLSVRSRFVSCAFLKIIDSLCIHIRYGPQRLETKIDDLKKLSKQYKVRYAPVEDTSTDFYFLQMAEIEEKFYE